MPISPEVAQTRAALGAAHRNAGRQPKKHLTAAQQNHRAAVMEDWISRCLAERPPLRPEQLARLAELLRPVRR